MWQILRADEGHWEDLNFSLYQELANRTCAVVAVLSKQSQLIN